MLGPFLNIYLPRISTDGKAFRTNGFSVGVSRPWRQVLALLQFVIGEGKPFSFTFLFLNESCICFRRQSLLVIPHINCSIRTTCARSPSGLMKAGIEHGLIWPILKNAPALYDVDISSSVLKNNNFSFPFGAPPNPRDFSKKSGVWKEPYIPRSL